MSLINLGIRLEAFGKQEEALIATEEAVATYRTLAKDMHDALPALAASISNLGSNLNRLGRTEEALKASKESVDIIRDYIRRNPDSSRRSLAARGRRSDFRHLSGRSGVA
jgi:tetratricopeptide (TPR) repeat protein